MGRKKKDKKPKKYAYLSKSSSYCARCGRDLLYSRRIATKDHVVPKYHGGEDDITNYMPLCKRCNGIKGHEIVYPACYYYQLNADSYPIKETNRKVLDYLRTEDSSYLEKHPLLFNELLFAVKHQYVSMTICANIGYMPGWSAHLFWDKVRPDDICVRDYLTDNEIEVLHPDNLYVTKFEGRRDTEEIFDVAVDNNSIVITLYKVRHRRYFYHSIKKFLCVFKEVYKNMGISNFVVTCTCKCMWASLQIFNDLKPWVYVDTINNRITYSIDDLIEQYQGKEAD